MDDNKSQVVTATTSTVAPEDQQAKNIFDKIIGWATGDSIPKNGEKKDDLKKDELKPDSAKAEIQTEGAKVEEGIKTFTEEDVRAIIAEEMTKLQTPKVTEIPTSKVTEKITETDRIANLEKDLRKRDAIKLLDTSGFPQDLVDLLDVSSPEALDVSFKNVTRVYQNSLENGIKERLKGRTPQTTNAVVGTVESQKAQARKLMGIKKK